MAKAEPTQRGPVEALPAADELFAGIVAEFTANHPGADTTAIERAYRRADELHTGQRRLSGEPFIVHPLIVTAILAGYGMDGATLQAALLHDTVEDTPATLEVIAADFGTEVAGLIDGVTKLDRIEFSSREEAQAATIRKMVIAMARDVRVLLIKLTDRLHNIRTLDPLPVDKQRRIAAETIEVYAPLAHRLGVQEVKHEMEERCFAVLYPKRMAEIEALVAKRAPEREASIEKATLDLRAALDAAGIEADIWGRPKHLYSIYRKMVTSGLEFEDIHDLIGIRVLVADKADCYAALGLVHSMWPPIHGRFKDYIAMPKFNLYQSLHTTVVGQDGKPLEVQIRTRDMHHRAEFGIAAHWRYKETGGTEVPFVGDLIQEELTDPQEFLSNLKLDLYQDEVFALTPKGDVLTLPRGSTPVDFAYTVHTDVGHACVGAKVNGRLVALDTELHSGDIVEIMTSKGSDPRPSRDWLDFVKSSRAAGKIRRWFTRERRDQSLAEGKESVAKALRREGLNLKAVDRDGLLGEVAQDLGHRDLAAMYVAIGDNHVSTHTVMRRLDRLMSGGGAADDDDLESVPSLRPTPRKLGGGIIVEAMEDLLVRLARCCSPVPGDDIVGFVTVGRGVSVHRADCANMGSLGERAERMIDVSWAPEQQGSFTVWFQIEALDRPKLLRDLTIVLGELGANIVGSSSVTGSDRIAVIRFEVELSDTNRLERIVAELRGIAGVFDAYRLVPQTT
ncbi:MAG: bifunctional (p)ppGpp synthetase/guanosine-3',5'-bis(diphosphate) 3'-pyrophosphohydrolase [Acidimicrobiia bacterium]|nr:bifunctional (p)ppGpp synthetase/guanosine-3',5'-bis(diphosphate) 3'-pyrophosphohydrolase [Acidimicrobiia bacterium]